MRSASRTMAACVLALVVIAPGATAARDLPDLPDWQLMFDTPWLWGLGPGAENPDDPAAPAGAWTVTPSPMADGILDLHVRVAPPEVSLPVEPGPAILYTSVALGGGLPGDVGFARPVSVGPNFVPACTGEPCAFEADVSVDLRQLPRIASRHPRLARAWAEVGFVLLRTFGGGTWLQELHYIRPDGTVFSGTLGDPAAASGRTPRVGLFPATGARAWREDGRHTDLLTALQDDRLRSLDDTLPQVTTDVRLIATFVGCDDPESGERLGTALRTAAGDLVTIPRAKGRDFIDATIPLPKGTTWRLGWASDEVFPDGTRQVAQSAATFEVADRPLLVTAAYRCREHGSAATDAAVAEVIAPEPSASPEA